MPQPNSDEMKSARAIAYRVGKRWASVEVEDVQSELYLWMCRNVDKLVEWRSDERGRGKLYVALKNAALRYCTKETAARSGQPLKRQGFYNEEMLYRTLPFLFEAWPETTVRQDPRTGKVLDRPFQFSNALAIMADISSAFNGLPADMKEVIEWYFRDGLTYAEIGGLKDITKEGARQYVARCVKRISDVLGD